MTTVDDARPASLTDEQIELVQSGFDTVVPQGEEFVARFYEIFFAQYPDTKLLFEGERLNMTQRQVLAALTLTIQGLKRPEALAPILRDVGARHVGYGVMPSYLGMFQSATLVTLKEFSGDAWTEEAEAAWDTALQTVMDLMREGMTGAHEDSGGWSRLSPAGRDGSEAEPPNLLSRIGLVVLNASPAVVTIATIALAGGLIFAARGSSVISQFVSNASAIAFILGLFAWVREVPERRKQAIFNAFQTIDAANGTKTSPARVIALESLASDRVSLRGLDLAGTSLLGVNIQGADLSMANLAGTDLRESNLADANLLDADLSGANLSHADLRKARLSFVNLAGADLTLANLEGADLTCANLTDADLSGAHLKGARLAGTEVQKTNLAGANLLMADMTGVALADVDLRGATLPNGDLVPE